MRKITLLIIALPLCHFLYAQHIGVGTTTPDASAMLDIQSGNKGLLVPRVALTSISDNTTIPSPQNSLLIYNTATIGLGTEAITPGYYYWGGGEWKRLVSATDEVHTAWKLGGNHGINPGIHFIGTNDMNPLLFKTAGVISGRLDLGTHNIGFGPHSLANLGTGVYNTAYGEYSLFANSLGYHNTAIGFSALSANTGGTYNTAVGASALSNNLSGYSNVAIGSYALHSNTTGRNLVAVGDSALLKNTGLANTALGSKALMSNTVGTSNTAAGYRALAHNVQGVRNTAFGIFALDSNINGTSNSAFGYRALYSNKSGMYNIAIGHDALFRNSFASGNIAIGSSALYNGDGWNNIAIGSSAMIHNNTGQYNTAIGYSTLFNSNTGSDLTAIGTYADVDADGRMNATAIGSRSLTACSNCVVLGSVAGVQGASSSVNVGIGVNNPLNTLHVVDNDPNIVKLESNNAIGTWLHLLNTSTGGNQWSMVSTGSGNGEQAGKLLFRNDNSSRVVATLQSNGNMGIGTVFPQYKLDILGRARIKPSDTTSWETAGIYLDNLDDVPSFVGMRDDDHIGFWGLQSSWSLVMQTTNGNVGIGLGSFGVPSEKLHVAGNICYTGTIGACSDMRYKKNFSKITNPLHAILSLNGIYYQWKTDEFPEKNFSEKRQLGFIAQDVEELFPELVLTDKEGYKSVDYGRLTTVLVEAIKEQQQQIEVLRKEIEVLKGR